MQIALFQFAGIRKNSRKKPPALKWLQGFGMEGGKRFANNHLVIADENQPESVQIAEALLGKMTKVRDKGEKWSLYPVNLGFQNPHSIDECRGKFGKWIESENFPKLRQGTRCVVAMTSGTAAQRFGLLEMLEEMGFDTWILLWDGNAQRFGSSAHNHSLDRELRRLSFLPVGEVVLIRGESGTGKTRFAKELSKRWKRQLISRNAAAISPNLIEANLFGYRQGDFTGAVAESPGAFGEANDQALFLDEIGELPLELQPKLLTALDVDQNGERTFHRLGGQEAKSSFFLILGTNVDLEEAVRNGKFRGDLFARINCHQLFLPPLRDRRHAIPGAILESLEKTALRYRLKMNPTEPALETILRMAFDEALTWNWNYRDVDWVAQQVLLDVVVELGHKHTDEIISLTKGHLLEEALRNVEKRLATRWPVISSQSDVSHAENGSRPEKDRRLLRVPEEDKLEQAALRYMSKEAYSRLSGLKRVEAGYLAMAMWESSGVHAEAWRYLITREIYISKSKNPSASFRKAWSRFDWREQA